MGRARHRLVGRSRVLICGLVLPWLSPLPAIPAASAEASATIRDASVTTVQSGIWGGGLLTTMAQDPNDPDRFIVGGDVSGLHVSTDAGVTWRTSNGGLNTEQEDTITSVVFRRFNDNRHKQVFASFGANGGGLLRSGDTGTTWTTFGPLAPDGGPNFEGHDACGFGPYPDPCSDPRATGHLLVLDEVSRPQPKLNFVYAGSFGRGLMRTNARGTSWTTIALGTGTSWCLWNDTPGCYITSLVQDPRRRNVLYVGTHGNGAFKVTGTTCSGDGCAEAGVSPILAGSGSDPIVDAEELWFQETADGPTLMCACGRQGFYRGNFPYTTLDQENTGIAFDTTLDHETALSAIGGAPEDPASAIYVGNVNALCELPEGGRNVECHTVYRSTDGGLTWEDVAFDQDVQKTVVGTTVEWWAFLCCRDNMLNQESYAANSILLTADDPPAVMVAGRSGVWKSTPDGDTHWQPAVQGMGTTIDIDAAVDPKSAGRAYVGGLDWTFFASATNLAPGSAVQSEPNKNFTHGFAIAVDSQTSDAVSPVYVGAGSNDVGVGGVYTSTDPTSPGTHPWTSLGFTVTGCDRTNPRVIGVGVGRLTQSATPLVFAATDGCGLWRYDGTLWQNVSAGTDMFATENAGFRFAPISYPNNLGSLLYVLDRQTGTVWASNNQGSPGSWVQVWQVLPPEATDTTDGSIVADPNATGTLWLTTNAPQGLHQLSCPVPPVPNGCVDTGPPPDDVVNPGPIAIRPCPDGCTSTIYVATRAVEGDTTPPALFKHLSGSSTWCNLTVGIDPMYRRAVNFPRQMAVSIYSGGVTTAYLATGGEGVLVVTDDTGDCGA